MSELQRNYVQSIRQNWHNTSDGSTDFDPPTELTPPEMLKVSVCCYRLVLSGTDGCFSRIIPRNRTFNNSDMFDGGVVCNCNRRLFITYAESNSALSLLRVSPYSEASTWMVLRNCWSCGGVTEMSKASSVFKARNRLTYGPRVHGDAIAVKPCIHVVE